MENGPVAMIFVEDPVEVASTVRHHIAAGFGEVLVFAPVAIDLDPAIEKTVRAIDYDVHAPGAMPAAVNAIIAAAPNTWLYYCYNAEYLFYPFSETRSVREMLAFHEEERRTAMVAYVLDLYAGDLTQAPDAISLESAHFDGSGYYALRRDRGRNKPLERQLDFYGGLKWRYEEHIPPENRRIDRVPLFKSKPGLELRPDHTLNDEEMNTYACPWHHNLTAAIASFRTAKALTTNPASRSDIADLSWSHSVPFEWSSRQLMDLGLMEPGQWF